MTATQEQFAPQPLSTRNSGSKGGYAVVHLPNIKVINRAKGEYELFPVKRPQLWAKKYSLLAEDDESVDSQSRQPAHHKSYECESSDEDMDLNDLDVDEGDLALNNHVGPIGRVT